MRPKPLKTMADSVERISVGKPRGARRQRHQLQLPAALSRFGEQKRKVSPDLVQQTEQQSDSPGQRDLLDWKRRFLSSN